jgi:hypothetical protein
MLKLWNLYEFQSNKWKVALEGSACLIEERNGWKDIDLDVDDVGGDDDDHVNLPK